MPTRLYRGSSVEQLESRRNEIAEEQVVLSEEHRELGRWINLKDLDLDQLKADKERLENLIASVEEK